MYLIDTHVLLWSLVQSDKLLAKEKAVLLDSYQKIFVSVASVWEIAIKVSIGKLVLPSDLQNNLEGGLAQSGFDILPIDFKVAWGVKDLPMYHSDPFDRLIISCAKSHNLTLISRDKIFKKYQVKLL
jgi:PIN domain nuclease of toxin-antitoxin system